MAEVRNRSRLEGRALDVVRQAISRIDHIDRLQSFDPDQSRFDFAGSVAYEDGTHDVLVAGGSVILSFATTCSGHVLSATIWSRRPAGDELARDRLAGPASASHLPSRGPCLFGGHRQHPLDQRAS